MTYGCYNRPPFKSSYITFDGYALGSERRVVKVKEIEYAMSHECQYSKDVSDVECVGCMHNQREKVNECGQN